jgi:carboxymethylenebutenolidase
LFERTFDFGGGAVVDPAGVPIRYGEGGERTTGYLSEAALPGAGVVVAHDWYGQLPHLRQRCDALAAAGMVTLAPDLYDGRLTADEAEAEALFHGLDRPLARARLLLSIEYLRRRGAERIGLLGFSAGGHLVLQLAGTTSVDVVVAYYAALGAAERTPIGCPVQLHLAEYDHWETPEVPEGFIEWLAASGTPTEVHRYPGAHHGFADANVPVFRAGSAELSWARTIRFLGSHLIWRPP